MQQYTFYFARVTFPTVKIRFNSKMDGLEAQSRLQGIYVVGKSSWKKREVGKSQVKFERSEILAGTLSYFIDNFPSSARIFQPQKKLSNFARFFPTSLGSFQLKQKLSIFRLANFSFFPIALSNWKRAVGKNEELESSTCYQKE